LALGQKPQTPNPQSPIPNPHYTDLENVNKRKTQELKI